MTQLGKACLGLAASLDLAYGELPLTSVQSQGSELLAKPETKDWEQTSHLAERQRHKGAAA
jgi:hypothetical protein